MIFVTGGTGILGSQLLFDLVRSDEPVKALFRNRNKMLAVERFFTTLDAENGTVLYQKIEWVYGDILDVNALNEHIKGCDYVYHCAALVSFHPKDFNTLMRVNRKGTANVVNVCLEHGIKKLCYVSSTAAIGGDEKAIITEETKWKNTPTTTGYSMSKYSAEKEVWRGIEEGLNAVMVNPCVILGAGKWSESSLTLFKTVSRGTSFYPTGSNAIVDARDVSEIMIRLMKSEIHSERFLCIGSNQSFLELITKCAKRMDIKPPTRKAPRWLVGIVRRILKFKSYFTGKRPDITPETVNALFGHREYSSEKVQKALLEFKFHSLEETLDFGINHRVR